MLRVRVIRGRPCRVRDRLRDDVPDRSGDLDPEALSAQEFQRRFGGVGGSAYRQMMAEIEARLDRLRLFAP